MVCSVWCMVCSVWCMVCSVWCMVCSVWCMVCSVCVWCVVCGVWCVVCGVYCVEYNAEASLVMQHSLKATSHQMPLSAHSHQPPPFQMKNSPPLPIGPSFRLLQRRGGSSPSRRQSFSLPKSNGGQRLEPSGRPFDAISEDTSMQTARSRGVQTSLLNGETRRQRGVRIAERRAGGRRRRQLTTMARPAYQIG